MRIGDRQLRMLIVMASPGRTLVVGDRESAAMERRGWLKSEHGDGDLLTITADGLRALADAMDAGRVGPMLAVMEREARAREKRAAARRGR